MTFYIYYLLSIINYNCETAFLNIKNIAERTKNIVIKNQKIIYSALVTNLITYKIFYNRNKKYLNNNRTDIFTIKEVKIFNNINNKKEIIEKYIDNKKNRSENISKIIDLNIKTKFKTTNSIGTETYTIFNNREIQTDNFLEIEKNKDKINKLKIELDNKIKIIKTKNRNKIAAIYIRYKKEKINSQNLKSLLNKIKLKWENTEKINIKYKDKINKLYRYLIDTNRKLIFFKKYINIKSIKKPNFPKEDYYKTIKKTFLSVNYEYMKNINTNKKYLNFDDSFTEKDKEINDFIFNENDFNPKEINILDKKEDIYEVEEDIYEIKEDINIVENYINNKEDKNLIKYKEEIIKYKTYIIELQEKIENLKENGDILNKENDKLFLEKTNFEKKNQILNKNINELEEKNYEENQAFNDYKCKLNQYKNKMEALEEELFLTKKDKKELDIYIGNITEDYEINRINELKIKYKLENDILKQQEIYENFKQQNEELKYEKEELIYFIKKNKIKEQNDKIEELENDLKEKNNLLVTFKEIVESLCLEDIIKEKVEEISKKQII